jgi:L-alanine-DL-glutamate epimerase-like enolase superfamily enzyme
MDDGYFDRNRDFFNCALRMRIEYPIRGITSSVYRIKTEHPESDGTFAWKETTLVLVAVKSGGKTGIGFSYGHQAMAEVIEQTFAPVLNNGDAMDIPSLWERMLASARNVGTRGIAAHALSAVDIALWDLKGKILNLPLCKLWGQARESVPIYGSGGFTSYTHEQLVKEFTHWKKMGVDQFKMKVGRAPDQDLKRVKQAREAIGNSSALFVDANGAYSQKQALEFAEKFKEMNVSWFEEPVPSDDLEGLHYLCEHAPAGMDIAAGEYGYDILYFRRMLEEKAIDVLQADATRCGGFTGFFQACQLARTFNIPLSSHTAPSVHLHACLTESNVRHMEYFHDHVRIEGILFDGVSVVKKGNLSPYLERPGHGLELKKNISKKYLIAESQ